ncbi:MAG: hypothetical protein HY304_05100 [candidate division Zixibacteria bacterium]|nr:hypothetical protein [candidate division Zixibacteria bacterium]
MADTVITCPKCGTVFPLDQILRKNLEASIRRQLGAEGKARELELSQREQSVGQLEHKLQQQLDRVEQRIAEEVKKKEVIIRKHVEKNIAEEKRLQMAELEDELAEKKELLKESQKSELAWKKRERELEERAANVELEVSRKLSEQRQPMN